MKTKNHIGEIVREFEIFVPRAGKRPLRYPVLDGSRAIAAMETLTKRGFAPVARTDGCGGEEWLTLSEMHEVVL